MCFGWKEDVALAHSIGSWAEEGSRVKPQRGKKKQNVGGVLAAGGRARTHSKHCRGTIEQRPKPRNVPKGSCLELATHSRDEPVKKKAGVGVPPPP